MRKKEIFDIISEIGWFNHIKNSLHKNILLYKETLFLFYIKRLKEWVNIRNLKSKIQNLSKTYSINSLINFAYLSNEGLIKPKQIKSEIRNLLNIIRKKKPQFLLEIGTAQGGTLFFFSRLAAENAVLISVDLPGGKYGGG